MRAGMSYFHETIWKGVPKFLRRVDTALKNIGIDERVPYNAPLIQFSSWMGGDRDGTCVFLDYWQTNHSLVFSCSPSNRRIWISGNPRVTPEVTRDVCLLARMMAANLYYNQIENLMFEVFISFYLYSFPGFHSLRFSWFIRVLLGSYLCGVALMNSVCGRMNCTGTQGKMLQNIT